MNILYWLEGIWPQIGGIEQMASKFMPAMQDRGFDFTLISNHDSGLPDHEQVGGVDVYRFPCREALENQDFRELMRIRKEIARIKRSFEPDLVHVNFSGPTALIFNNLLAGTDTTPVLLAMRGMPLHDFERDSLLGKTLRSADWTISVSEVVLRHLVEVVPEIKSRSSVIYNGQEIPELPPSPLSFDEPRLLCLGRLVSDKGFDLALTAFAALVDKFPRARMTIGGDGPLRSELERMASELQIDHAVDFVGWVEPDDVPAVLNSATLVLLPSRNEGLPSVAVQAGLMGRPTVAARVAGLAEVVVDDETGLLIDPEDCHGLADAITFLLRHPNIAEQMGRSARARAGELFNFDSYIESHVRLYEKLGACAGAVR